jgi:poly(beta-D-mannuronate) lyase
VTNTDRDSPPLAHAGLSLLVLLAACSPGGDGVVVTDPPVASGSDGGAAPAADDTLDTRQPPSRNFDLSQWKLTLPSGEEVKTAELNAGYSVADVFYTDPDTGGMVFRCPNIGGTTPNSQFSRTELREMLAPDGPAHADENNWTTATGGTLRATLRVDRVSTTGEDYKVGRVIIGQIHGQGAEVIRLYYHKRPDEARGRIYGGLDSADNLNSWSPDIIPNSAGSGIALGEVFAYEISLHGLQLSVRIEPPSGDAATYYKDIDPGYEGTNLYFKAGVYNQNNTGDVSDYVQATFFILEHTH